MKRQFKNLIKISAFAFFGLFLHETAMAQCESWEAYPKGEKEAKVQHVLYRDRINTNRIEEAYPIWEALFQTVKVSKPNDNLHYTDGGRMSLHFAKKEQDATKKQEWIDKAVALYDQNAKCNGDDALTRAYEAYYLYDAQAPVTTTFGVYMKSLDLDKADKPAPAMILQPMAYLSVYCYTNNFEGFDADYMRNLYERLKKFCEEKIAKKVDPAGYENGWKEVDKYFEPIKEYIFGCDYWVAQLTPAFEGLKKAEKNEATLDSMYAVAAKLAAKCGKEHELYTAVWNHYKALKLEIFRDKLSKVIEDPNAAGYEKYNAYAQLIDIEEDKADEYKEKQWEFYPDVINNEKSGLKDEDRATFAYRYADHLYRQGNFGGARTYCRTASKYRPNWGKPYLLVGSMYASSGSRCSPETNGTGFNAQVCVWPAMDEWYKAKSVDASAAEEANRLIGRYSEFLPSKVELAQRGIAEGSAYTVGCWIQQGTTARGK